MGIQLDPLDGLALIGATIVGFMVLLRLGALGPWRNALGGFFPIVLPLIVGLGLVLGLSMHLDTSGLPASGEIVLKEEQVRFAHNGSWTRSQRLLVKYAPLSPAGYFIRETSGRETSDPLLNRMRIEGEGRQIDVDVDTYDRLRVGDRIGVRYLAQKPGLFRLEGQSTESWLWSIAGMIPLWLVWLVGCIVMAVFWLSRGQPTRVSLAAFAAIALGWSAPFLWLSEADHPGGDSVSGSESATAKVIQIRRISESVFSSRRHGDPVRGFVQPYDLVELEVYPEDKDRVRAVDGLDVDSLPGLAVGASVAVAFPPGDPREARVVEGTRDYRARNQLGIFQAAAVTVASLAVMFGVIALLGWLFVRWLPGFLLRRLSNRSR